MIKSKVFTEEQIQFIIDNCKGISERDLWHKVNERFGTDFTFNQVKGFKSRNKLKNGLSSQFEKGQEPFNKGLKQTDYMSEESIERSRSTRFKKGQKPINYEQIGYERVGKDGYIEIKVRDSQNVHSTRNFEMKHRVIWEKYHGQKLGKNEVVIFMDQDKRNFNIDNLKKITRADLARMNIKGFLTEDANINQAAINWSKLQQAIKENANVHHTN